MSDKYLEAAHKELERLGYYMHRENLKNVIEAWVSDQPAMQMCWSSVTGELMRKRHSMVQDCNDNCGAYVFVRVDDLVRVSVEENET